MTIQRDQLLKKKLGLLQEQHLRELSERSHGKQELHTAAVNQIATQGRHQNPNEHCNSFNAALEPNKITENSQAAYTELQREGENLHSSAISDQNTTIQVQSTTALIQDSQETKESDYLQHGAANSNDGNATRRSLTGGVGEIRQQKFLHENNFS
jgi:hypothetical protein